MPAALWPNVQAGRMSRRIVIQQATGTTDADTEADTDAGIVWTTLCSAWASVQPLNGTAVGAPNAQLQGVVTYLVSLRYQAGIVNGMQVYEPATGLTLDILAVIDINEQHRQLRLEAVDRRYPPV